MTVRIRFGAYFVYIFMYCQYYTHHTQSQ